MATPQESITTVSGRRCTRSRARTAATSTTTSTDLTSSTTTTSDVQQIQSSAAAAPPPPPPSSTQQAPDVAPTTAAPASSAAPASPPPASPSPASPSPAPPSSGTDSPVSSAVAASSPLANVAPSPPAAVAPGPGAVIVDPGVSQTQAAPGPSTAAEVSGAPASTSTTSSNTSDAAVTSSPLLPASTSAVLESAVPVLSPVESASQQPEQSVQPAIPSDLQPDTQPVQSSQPTSTGIPTGGSAGIISPDQGPSDGNGLTLPNGQNTNVGGIVGGVVGGFAGVILISVLLFLCLRKRKSREPFEQWQKQPNEKGEDDAGSGFLVGLKQIPEKLRAIPAGIGALVGKMRGEKTGPAQNPYRRHTAHSSISSVYSVTTNRRSQSISEPPSKFQQQLRGFGNRLPSLKRSRTLLQKKQDSLVVGPQSPFPGIVEDPVVRNSKVDNPFADPGPLEQPKTLQLLNPDPSSRNGTPRQQQFGNGLLDQQRGPTSPKPVAISSTEPRDPFASILDELEERDGSGTPEWLHQSAHKRTQSAVTALHSHPPSNYTASVYTTADNPFLDPADAPPMPRQPLPPNPPKRPSNAYAMPMFNTTSSAASRESTGSFYFGEPGPSRPTTKYSEFSTVPRAGRQSDPFDLDRPEVLGFGNVTGRREVRSSVTRQNSRKRTSSVPNWVRLDEGPYERTSAIPGPLRNPSVKR